MDEAGSQHMRKPMDPGLFAVRLRNGLRALAQTIARPQFGQGAASMGAEIEVCLVDTHGKPAPINAEVRGESDDTHITFEIDRFNLELNTEPVSMNDRPFSTLGDAIRNGLSEMNRAAAVHHGEVVTIGILPTLGLDDLQASAMTRTPRYEALNDSLRRGRSRPFRICIDGPEPLEAECDDVTIEGANTSLQIHLKVPPSDFARTYNAAQLATLPTLAVSSNAPLLMGHRLWDETRIALFKQSVDDRAVSSVGGFPPPRVSFGHGWVRQGAYELFEESVMFHAPLLPFVSPHDPLEQVAKGQVPGLDELRLHHGTVWRWNRAVYDPTGGGHLRIEMRALPSGPSVTDMMANAAYLVGLTLGLAPEADRIVARIPFEHARWSFYRAAQFGLDAELLWPRSEPPSPRRVQASTLALELLPTARAGLVAAGVGSDEADRWLDIVRARLESGVTGARWQRAKLARLERTLGRPAALQQLVREYARHARSDVPVHLWPMGE